MENVFDFSKTIATFSLLENFSDEIDRLNSELETDRFCTFMVDFSQISEAVSDIQKKGGKVMDSLKNFFKMMMNFIQKQVRGHLNNISVRYVENSESGVDIEFYDNATKKVKTINVEEATYRYVIFGKVKELVDNLLKAVNSDKVSVDDKNQSSNSGSGKVVKHDGKTYVVKLIDNIKKWFLKDKGKETEVSKPAGAEDPKFNSNDDKKDDEEKLAGGATIMNININDIYGEAKITNVTKDSVEKAFSEFNKYLDNYSKLVDALYNLLNVSYSKFDKSAKSSKGEFMAVKNIVNATLNFNKLIFKVDE